jgi:hypothetical protein
VLRWTLAGLVFAVLLALPGLALGADAARRDAQPSYLKPWSAEFSINDSWQGARQVSGVSTAGVAAVPGDPGKMIWAPTCGAAKQNVVFRRTIELLGPASSGSFRWSMTTVHNTPKTQRWTGLQTLEVDLNGAVVYRWNRSQSSNSFTFPAAALKGVRVGSNTFQVRATRNALPAGVSACNLRGQQPLIAITGLFDFAFQTDLRVGVPAENPAIRHATSLVIQQFVKNEGPDRALDGELYVSYCCAGSGALTVVMTGGKSCELEGKAIYHCRFSQLDPGQQLSVLVKVTYMPSPDFPNWDHQQETVLFRAMSKTADPNSANDAFTNGFIFCQDGSTLPQCK